MLICDKVVFVELHKTGTTHIKWLLRRTVGGVSDGKHTVPSRELIDSGRRLIGSIRSPWAWYVSLWAYGCDGKGGLRTRLMRQGAARDQSQAMGLNWIRRRFNRDGQRRLGNAQFTPQQWYSDPGNVDHFRDWLRFVLSTSSRGAIEKPYATAVGAIGGLLTARYFHLFVREGGSLPGEIDSVEKLSEFEVENNFMDFIVNQSNLVPDLIVALCRCGVNLDAEQIEFMRTAKSRNTSSRPHPVAAYYDQTTCDLVAQRDRLIIEKFHYDPPAILQSSIVTAKGRSEPSGHSGSVD